MPDLLRRGAKHGQQGRADQRQRGDKAQVQRRVGCIGGGLGHHPAEQIAQHQLGVHLLEDAFGRVRAEVLDIQAVFPLAINGFDGPAAMVEIDEFGGRELGGVQERGEQPTGAESGALIMDQSAGDLLGQAGTLASAGRAGFETHDPIALADPFDPPGPLGGLSGKPQEIMSVALRDSPDRGVGKKNLGRRGADRSFEACGSNE